MATYLQGVTDYIPQIQPWTPDYNFYQSALEKKQNMYDAGWQRMNTLYNSMLNTEMTRDDNIAKRDQYFKSIQQDINRLSGLDLSIQQNVDAASQIFNPIIKDKYILNDMSWTKRYQQEMQKAESFRNCTDPKKCGGKYWNEGVEALNYMKEDFRNYSADDALYAPTPRYVPYTNAIDEAFKKLKDYGFKQKGIRYSPDGRYIIKEVNGREVIEPMANFLLSTVGSDPEVMDVYTTQAYVARKRWMNGNIDNYNSPVEAEQAYYNTLLQPAINSIEESAAETAEYKEKTYNDLGVFDQYIKDVGIVPGSKEHKQYSDLSKEAENASAYDQYINDVLDNATNISNNDNTRALRMNSDAVVAFSLLQNDLISAAQSYQELTHEIDIEADQYKLAAYKEELSYNYGVARDQVEALLDVWTHTEKKKIDELAEFMKTAGGADQNTFGTEDDKDGAGADNKSGHSKVQGMKKDIQKTLQGSKATALATMFMHLSTLDMKNYSENFGADWDFAQIFLNPNKYKSNISGNLVSVSAKDALKKQYGIEFGNGMSSTAAMKKIQEANIKLDANFFLNNFSYDQLDHMYKKMLQVADPTRENTINDKKQYLNKVWENEEYGMKKLVEASVFGDELYAMYNIARKEGWSAVEDKFNNYVVNGMASMGPGPGLIKVLSDDSFYNNFIIKDEKIEELASIMAEESYDKQGNLKDYADWSLAVKKRILPWYQEGYAEKNEIPIYDNDGNVMYSIQNPDLSLSMSGGTEFFHMPYDNYYVSGSGTIYGETGNMADPETGAPEMMPLYNAGYNIPPLTIDGVTYDKPKFNPEQQWLEDHVNSILGRAYFGEDGTNPEQKLKEYAAAGVDFKKIDVDFDKLLEAGMDFGIQDMHFNFWNNEETLAMDTYLGAGIGGSASMANTAKDVDPSNYSSAYMRYSKSLFDDISNLSSDVSIQGFSLTKSKALEIINEYKKHVFDQKWKNTDKSRPKFSITYLDNYKGSPGTAKVNIKFDRDWIEANDGTKADGGLTRIGTGDDSKTMYSLATDGITLTMPTANAQNLFHLSSGVDHFDKIVKNRGYYDFTELYPYAGDIKLNWDEQNFRWSATGYVNEINEKGQLVKSPIPQIWNDMLADPSLSFSSIYANWKKPISDLNNAIASDLKEMNADNLVKDPEQLKESN